MCAGVQQQGHPGAEPQSKHVHTCVCVCAWFLCVQVFSDRDILEQGPSADRVAAALDKADVFFGSLLFDFDQVMLVLLPPGFG